MLQHVDSGPIAFNDGKYSIFEIFIFYHTTHMLLIPPPRPQIAPQAKNIKNPRPNSENFDLPREVRRFLCILRLKTVILP